MNRLTILFAMHYEAGHVLGTFNLAKQLRSRGHEIAYLSIPDFKELIENQSFRFVPFAEDIMPAGFNNRSFSGYWSRRRYNESIFSRYMEKLTDGTLDRALQSVKPDLLICDPFLSYVAIRAISLGIPAMHLFSSLFLYENPEIPPVITYMFPRSRIATLMAWKYMFLRFFFFKKLKNIFTAEFRHPARMHHLVDAYLQVARKSGFPCIKDRTYRLNEIGFNLAVPDIVLCTRAFQFPGNIPKQRIYLGNFVDYGRKDSQIELNLDDRPVIYCSLGTAASTYPYSDRFYGAVRKAGEMRRDWQFVLQISDEKKIRNYESTENLQILKWVPQLFLLKRASVTVTHGGLNSIMECVNSGVPMVIVPGLRDQPGNAARAVYQNIALTAKMRDIEPSRLAGLIAEAMDSREIKAGLKRMKEMIEHENGLAESVSFIESYATSGGKIAD